MSTKLSNAEQMLLKELHHDPRFASIMEKARNSHQLYKFRRGKTTDDNQTERWIYSSGYIDGVDFVLSLMGYNHGQ